MRNINNIKKSYLEIAHLIASNQKIQQLLLDDTDDLSSKENKLTLEELINGHYITFYPLVEADIVDKTRNTFIVLFVSSISFEENMSADCDIYVTTDSAHFQLKNGGNRLLDLTNEIVKTLDGVKLSSASEIRVNNVSMEIISEMRASYDISISFADQNTEKATI
jgi:hypothetical protein